MCFNNREYFHEGCGKEAHDFNRGRNCRLFHDSVIFKSNVIIFESI